MAKGRVQRWIDQDNEERAAPYKERGGGGMALEASVQNLHNQWRPFTARQLEVMERAADSGYLYDPDPDMAEFLQSIPVVVECPDDEWGDFFIAPRGWRSYTRHDAYIRDVGAWGVAWEAARDRHPEPRLVPGWSLAATPGHFAAWRSFWEATQHKPAVVAGRLLPSHLAEGQGRLGIVVNSVGHHPDYTFAGGQWPQLVRLLAPAAAAVDEYLNGWVYFDGSMLAVEVPHEDAEALARAAADLVAEIVQPGFGSA